MKQWREVFEKLSRKSSFDGSWDIFDRYPFVDFPDFINVGFQIGQGTFLEALLFKSSKPSQECFEFLLIAC